MRPYTPVLPYSPPDLASEEYIGSTIKWLYELPKSPLESTQIRDLINPYTMYRLFKIFLNEADFDSWDEHHFNERCAVDINDKGWLVIPGGLLRQIFIIEKIYTNHINGSDYNMTAIDWNKIVLLSNIDEITRLCRVLRVFLVLRNLHEVPDSDALLESIQNDQRLPFKIDKIESGEDYVESLKWENSVLERTIQEITRRREASEL